MRGEFSRRLDRDRSFDRFSSKSGLKRTFELNGHEEEENAMTGGSRAAIQRGKSFFRFPMIALGIQNMSRKKEQERESKLDP